QLARNPVSRTDRDAEHSEASGVPQRVVTLLEMRATNRIGNQIHTTTVRELHQLRLPVLFAIVDRVVQPAISQKLVLARTRSAVSHRADLLRDVECGESDTAAGI